MQDNPASTNALELFCWILDVSYDAFPVSIEESRTVGDLKEAILEKKLPNVVDPKDIVVWRVSIQDKPNLRKEMCKDHWQYVDKEALFTSRPLSKVFPSKPAEKTISIVVQVRTVRSLGYDQRSVKRIRLSDPFYKKLENPISDSMSLQYMLSMPVKPLIDNKISVHQILQQCRPAMQTLIIKAGRKPLIPLWILKQEISGIADLAFENHINRLAIPAINGLPSLLLHELGSESSVAYQKQAEYITSIFLLEYHTVLINPSGSGKTRLGLQGLCQNWGFYGVANQVSNGIGSEDLWQLISQVSQDNEAAPYMHQKVQHCILQFLLSRFLLLNLLITEAFKCEEGLRPSDHRYLWVLLQARPIDLLGIDIFVELAKALQMVSVNNLKKQIQKEYQKLKSKGILRSGNCSVTGKPTYRPLFCFLDEIQTYKSSSNNKKTDWPLLRLVWDSISNILEPMQMRVILSGTAINEKSLDNIWASSIFKFSNYIIKKDIGAFDNPDAQQLFIEYYLPFVNEQSEARKDFIKKAWRWCHGRYYNTATLVELILITGPNSSHKVLNNFVKYYTNVLPTDGQK